MGSEPRYDVFLSCTGRDRQAGRDLAKELRRLGLWVFFDEDSIRHFESITESIRHSLEMSKVFVAYYSLEYATRPACQIELTAAFIAGLREGDPCRRIIIVNPESGPDHLFPKELADARFALAPSGEIEVFELALVIRRRIEALNGAIGDLSFTQAPIWFNRRPGTYGLACRYREMWMLHSVLHAVDYPLTSEPTGHPVAVVWGEAGSGKTSLVASYAWHFGAAFKDGAVYWLDLAGNGTALANYQASTKALGHQIGLDVEYLPHSQLIGAIGRHVAGSAGHSLWIVDNIPNDFPVDSLDELIIPAGDKIRTILICENDIFREHLQTLKISPLPLASVNTETEPLAATVSKLAEAEAAAVLSIARSHARSFAELEYLVQRAIPLARRADLPKNLIQELVFFINRYGVNWQTPHDQDWESQIARHRLNPDK